MKGESLQCEFSTGAIDAIPVSNSELAPKASC